MLAGFFLVPVLMMLPTSFRRVHARARAWCTGVWTLENYTRIVTDDYYREVIWRTLGLGLFVTLRLPVLGYPLAYLIARGPERWRVPLILLVIFPMLLNLVVRSFGWIALLANRGLVNNLLIQLGLIDDADQADVQPDRADDRAHPHLPAVHGADAGRRHPATCRATSRPRPRRSASSRLHVFASVTLPLSRAGHSRRLDPGLRADHQRAGDAAHARRPDLQGHGDADL